MRRRHPLWCCLLLLACLVTASAAAETVAPVVDRVRFCPASGHAEQMAGGRFVGSNTGETVGFVELGRIEGAPPEGQWTELELTADRPCRYVKYVGPDGSHGLVAELEFYAGNHKLEGEPFGVAGARERGRDFHKALDGHTSTWFDAFLADGAYVGLDLGAPGNVAPEPTFHAAPGHHRRALVVSITSAAPGGRILYTTDGSLPTPEHGQEYREPVYVAEGVTRLRAIVCREGFFPGPIASGTYRVGDVPPPSGLTTFHVGNSLTDTINGWLKPVAESAGYAHTYYRFTIPGAPTDWLWVHPGSGFGAKNYPRAFVEAAPIDHLSTQPFAGHGRSLENETRATGNFYRMARESSPEVQLWLYQQWPGRTFGDRWAQARGDDMEPLGLKPATTWEEAVRNHLAYFEALRRRIDAEYGGQPVRIVPAGLVMLNLKRAIEAGEVPGITRFFEEHYGEGDRGPGCNIHMIAKGRYMVALTFYCCLYGESPEGRVDLPTDVTTLTPEQDRVYKRIAWETVRDYPWAGVGGE